MSTKSKNLKIKRSKPNYIYAIISVALVLFLLGFFGLIAFQTQQLITSLKEQVNILVEFKPETPRPAINKVKHDLLANSKIKKGSVIFISKETAAENLKEELGEDFLNFDFQNPLYDMIQFNIRAEFMTAGVLKNIKSNLIKENIVNDVYYQEGLVAKIANNLSKIGLFSLITGLLLLIVAITLIHNTIKLTLYANRFIIKNMELVGATWRFISWPYIINSIRNGFLSALIAIGMLIGLVIFAQNNIPSIWDPSHYQMYLVLFGVLILIGIFITSLSTYYVVNKYLRMRLDDLY